MTEPTSEEVKELFASVIAVLDNKPGSLQFHVIANLVASFSLSANDDPYSTARNIYKSAKFNIADNLKKMGILLNAPKGAKPN
jgi:hypothetical protein